MTDPLSNNSDFNSPTGEISIDAEHLLLKLRQKQENWIAWGDACQKLQKSGYNSQAIFEATGFEPIHQNQIIVAAQVYTSIVKAGATAEVLDRFQRTGSDILYELRILTQTERLSAAEFIAARGLDSTAATEVARAIKDFSRLGKLPEGFSRSAGDMVAYHYWKLAKQQTNLQERSRLIVRGLMFAETQTAKEQIELILGETATPQAKAPILPLHRLEAEEELPRLIPFAGSLDSSLAGYTPLTLETWQQTPTFSTQGIFAITQLPATQPVVALPGWATLKKAIDPVAIVTQRDQTTTASGKPEINLMVIDRSQKEWNQYSHFLFLEEAEILMGWFSEPPKQTILGQLILLLRPKIMIERAAETDSWEIEE
ncbi:MAG: phosphate/phosphite/phosphonate ABC transporter substrate-binding protein [Coleofasciculaceae cyanobacterium SM2_1_6]|nr:phosphate/phosphite/phosphonate ABC transporter substrate-binding protein [Coleofasciculaceae cyanobacterium SM2_1_6]